MAKFEERMKSIRKSKKITQKQLAQTVDVYQSRIARWESGVNEPSIEMLKKLAEALDTSIDYLVGYSDKK